MSSQFTHFYVLYVVNRYTFGNKKKALNKSRRASSFFWLLPLVPMYLSEHNNTSVICPWESVKYLAVHEKVNLIAVHSVRSYLEVSRTLMSSANSDHARTGDAGDFKNSE